MFKSLKFILFTLYLVSCSRKSSFDGMDGMESSLENARDEYEKACKKPVEFKTVGVLGGRKFYCNDKNGEYGLRDPNGTSCENSSLYELLNSQNLIKKDNIARSSLGIKTFPFILEGVQKSSYGVNGVLELINTKDNNYLVQTPSIYAESISFEIFVNFCGSDKSSEVLPQIEESFSAEPTIWYYPDKINEFFKKLNNTVFRLTDAIVNKAKNTKCGNFSIGVRYGKQFLDFPVAYFSKTKTYCLIDNANFCFIQVKQDYDSLCSEEEHSNYEEKNIKNGQLNYQELAKFLARVASEYTGMLLKLSSLVSGYRFNQSKGTFSLEDFPGGFDCLPCEDEDKNITPKELLLIFEKWGPFVEVNGVSKEYFVKEVLNKWDLLRVRVADFAIPVEVKDDLHEILESNESSDLAVEYLSRMYLYLYNYKEGKKQSRSLSELTLLEETMRKKEDEVRSFSFSKLTSGILSFMTCLRISPFFYLDMIKKDFRMFATFCGPQIFRKIITENQIPKYFEENFAKNLSGPRSRRNDDRALLSIIPSLKEAVNDLLLAEDKYPLYAKLFGGLGSEGFDNDFVYFFANFFSQGESWKKNTKCFFEVALESVLRYFWELYFLNNYVMFEAMKDFSDKLYSFGAMRNVFKPRSVDDFRYDLSGTLLGSLFRRQSFKFKKKVLLKKEDFLSEKEITNKINDNIKTYNNEITNEVKKKIVCEENYILYINNVLNSEKGNQKYTYDGFFLDPYGNIAQISDEKKKSLGLRIALSEINCILFILKMIDYISSDKPIKELLREVINMKDYFLDESLGKKIDIEFSNEFKLIMKCLKNFIENTFYPTDIKKNAYFVKSIQEVLFLFLRKKQGAVNNSSVSPEDLNEISENKDPKVSGEGTLQFDPNNGEELKKDNSFEYLGDNRSESGISSISSSSSISNASEIEAEDSEEVQVMKQEVFKLREKRKHVSATLNAKTAFKISAECTPELQSNVDNDILHLTAEKYNLDQAIKNLKAKIKEQKNQKLTNNLGPKELSFSDNSFKKPKNGTVHYDSEVKENIKGMMEEEKKPFKKELEKDINDYLKKIRKLETEKYDLETQSKTLEGKAKETANQEIKDIKKEIFSLQSKYELAIKDLNDGYYY